MDLVNKLDINDIVLVSGKIVGIRILDDEIVYEVLVEPFNDIVRIAQSDLVMKGEM